MRHSSRLEDMPETVTQLNINQKTMIPSKVQCRLPTYTIGAVSAGGTHWGKKDTYIEK